MSLTIILCFFINSITPPTDVIARDNPNDDGGKINVTWTLSTDDQQLDGYEIYRKAATDTAFTERAFRGKSVTSYLDEETKDGTRYYYKISAVKDTEVAESAISIVAISSPQWFDTSKIGVVVFAALFIFLILFFISRRKKG